MAKARDCKRWQFRGTASCPVDYEETVKLGRDLGIHPLVARLLINRGWTKVDSARSFLYPKLTDLHDPALMAGVEPAAQRLARAIADRQRIVIYGDYDVDGITASAILWHVLTEAGGCVDTYLPHRIDEGYGLSGHAIEQIANSAGADSQPPLIISVDCGITAIEPARVAKQLGIDLIITDHHEFASANNDETIFPDALILVHPRLPGSDYPFGDLCGAGVAFKLAWQLAKVHCGTERLPQRFKLLILDLLSLAALGSVADAVPLVGENRVLTRYGLGTINQTRFSGLNALIDAAGLRDEKIDSFHIGFVLGPRLNACGRMGHAQKALRLLTNAPPDETVQIADLLTKENQRRQETQRAVLAQAKQMVAESGYDRDHCRAIVVGQEGWHPGVLGVVASRLVDEYYRPAVVLSYDREQNVDIARGSARSVPGISIHDILQQCSQHLDRFGGHAMAAGLQLRMDRVDVFRDELVDAINTQLSVDDLVSTIQIDAECCLSDFNLDLVEQIQTLAPFGRGNPVPLFAVRGVTVDGTPRRIGSRGKHLRLALRQKGRRIQAVAFGMGHWAEQLASGIELDLVVEPKISTWNGRRTEVHVKDLRTVSTAELSNTSESTKSDC